MNGGHLRPAIITDRRRLPPLQVIYQLLQDNDSGGGPQISPIQRLQNGGIPSRVSKSKFPIGMDVNNSPVN